MGVVSFNECACHTTSNKKFVLDVGMEKEQKQELGWSESVLPIPAIHHSE